VVPAFSTGAVKPHCGCSDSAPADPSAEVDFERAVADAYAAFETECADEDPLQTLLRMQHFASSASMAMLEGNTKLFLSCLVSNAALSRLLSARALTSDEDSDDDDDADLDGATSRDP
jgi:hypothetical protein